MEGLSDIYAAAGAQQQEDESSPFAPFAAGKQPQPQQAKKPSSDQEPKSIFELPDDPVAEGERIAQAVSETFAWLGQERVDRRCDACVLGTVLEVFPRFGAALSDRGLAVETLRGVWVVPPFTLKDLGTEMRWHAVRGRLAPFMKNDYLHRIDGELRTGAAIDWVPMGLQADNLVLVKRQLSWAELWQQLRRSLTWREVRQLVRGALRRERIAEAAAWLWPFPWSWLVGWCVALVLIVATHVATAVVMPTTWRDVVTLLFGNLTVVVYVARGRAPIEGALRDARSFKTAGSVALRRGNLEVALKQYAEGNRAAARLEPMRWYLNARAAREGVGLQAACLNNMAIAHLKEKEWEKAVHSCTRVLDLALPSPAPRGGRRRQKQPPPPPPAHDVARAKAYFRRAVAQAKLGAPTDAKADLLEANALLPDDKEVVGMIQLLHYGERRRQQQQSPPQQESARVDGSTDAAPADARETSGAEWEAMAAAEREAVASALAAATDPGRGTDTGAFGQWAPQADSTAPAADDAASAAAAPEVAAGPASAPHRAAAPPGPAPPSVAAAAAASAAAAAAAPGSGAGTTTAAGGGGTGASVDQRFSWARDCLARRFARIACQDEDGALLVVDGVLGLSGEAAVSTSAGPRRRRTHGFDLRVELGWRARVCDTPFAGKLVFSDVASHNEPDEYQLDIEFDAQPDQGSEAEAALINLFGPLRRERARAAPDKLSQKLWEAIDGFRDEFLSL